MTYDTDDKKDVDDKDNNNDSNDDDKIIFPWNTNIYWWFTGWKLIIPEAILYQSL